MSNPPVDNACRDFFPRLITYWGALFVFPSEAKTDIDDQNCHTMSNPPTNNACCDFFPEAHNPLSSSVVFPSEAKTDIDTLKLPHNEQFPHGQRLLRFFSEDPNLLRSSVVFPSEAKIDIDTLKLPHDVANPPIDYACCDRASTFQHFLTNVWGVLRYRCAVFVSETPNLLRKSLLFYLQSSETHYTVFFNQFTPVRSLGALRDRYFVWVRVRVSSIHGEKHNNAGHPLWGKNWFREKLERANPMTYPMASKKIIIFAK